MGIGQVLWKVMDGRNWVRVSEDLQKELSNAYEEYKLKAKYDETCTQIMTSVGKLSFGPQNFSLQKPMYLGEKQLRREVIFWTFVIANKYNDSCSDFWMRSGQRFRLFENSARISIEI